MGLVSTWLPFLDSRLMARWFSDGNFWWLSPVPLLTLAVAAALWRSATHPRRDLPPFLLSLALFVLSLLAHPWEDRGQLIFRGVLVGLLAVTGMRIGEAIGLDCDDLDMGGGIVTIRKGKFGKARALPLHPTTVAVLQNYLLRADRPGPSGAPVLLSSSTGKRLRYSNVHPTFQKLLHHCGIVPRSATCRPRIHDLRHSFAVSTIADGYRTGNPGSRLATLATYLGHVDPKHTYWYLSAAPELLGLAGDMLERHLAGEA